MIEITIKRGEEKISLAVYEDNSIDDWIDTFKVILKWVTFDDVTINEVFNERE